nr:HAMP domain-containing sensor histidine kinase [Arthrospira sp. SH-MAG29]
MLKKLTPNILSRSGLNITTFGLMIAISLLYGFGYFVLSHNVVPFLISLISVLGATGIAWYSYQKQQKWHQEKLDLENYIQDLRESWNLQQTQLEQSLHELTTKYHYIEQENIRLSNTNIRKDEFLRQTSHELRTPLNGIICSLQLLLDELYDNSDEEAELLQQAYESSLHLIHLINQVLDLSKIEAGKVAIDLKPIDLHASLTAAIYLQFGNFRKKNLHLYRQDFFQGIKIKADPNKLKQVLINVIGNAIKFTDRGNITIITELRQVKSNQSDSPITMAVVTVKDTGIGIEPKNQQRLFQAFQVENESNVNPQGSTGLGLMISKNFVEMMGGSIYLSSPGRNQGTTIEIMLPLAEQQKGIDDSNTKYD